ncbi:MAG: hypothetical protein IT445_17505 [Phycisphaeraceae bacterium]|nr:hypothetical protein [Phycisphaeraceae bacterium]
MSKPATLRLVSMLAIALFAAQAMAISLDIETFKDNTIFRDATTTVQDYQDAGSGLLRQSIYNSVLLYAAIDLSALPANTLINSAAIKVYDERTNQSHTVIASLADVADDWDESTFNWDTAAAGYGATIGHEMYLSGDIANAAMVNFSNVLWQGACGMSLNPGTVTSVSRAGELLLKPGSDTYHGGVDWTDDDLISGLHGIIHGDDIAVIVMSGVYGTNNYTSDRLASGATSGHGITLSLEYVEAHAGDANGDDMVNLSDLQILGDNWQSASAHWGKADFTGDSAVNLADLQILGDNWGYGTSADISFDQAVALVGIVIPEPASLSLLALTLPLVLRRRR